jgi:hypothetical protein
MKAKLFKEEDIYYLSIDNKLIGSTYPKLPKGITYKLSLKNCDEIFGVVDVEKLAYDFSWNHQSDPNYGDTIHIFKEGFNKKAEIDKDKVFTLEDMMNCWNKALKFQEHKETLGEYIQSFQQPTEIEVMIEMGKVVDETKVIGAVKSVKGSGHKITTYKSVPKLDSSGQLILKKI